jgi:hypothetical protein
MAGFFDGEGCIHLQMDTRQNRKAVFSLQVCITQKTRKELDEIMSEFGGQVYQHSGGCFRWRVTSLTALKFLEAVQPYCHIKKEQVDLAIQFANSLRRVNMGCIPQDDEVRQMRVGIYNRLKELKNHGGA